MSLPNELALWILKDKDASPTDTIYLPYVYIYRITKKLCMIEGAYPDGNIASGKIFQSFDMTKDEYFEDSNRFELILHNHDQKEIKFKEFLRSIRQYNIPVVVNSPSNQIIDEDPSSEDSEEIT
jgi:hypothetical protein